MEECLQIIYLINNWHLEYEKFGKMYSSSLHALGWWTRRACRVGEDVGKQEQYSTALNTALRLSPAHANTIYRSKNKWKHMCTSKVKTRTFTVAVFIIAQSRNNPLSIMGKQNVSRRRKILFGNKTEYADSHYKVCSQASNETTHQRSHLALMPTVGYAHSRCSIDTESGVEVAEAWE